MKFADDKSLNVVQRIFWENPLILYDYLLRETLLKVYTTKIQTENVITWKDYSNLLIDKFAIHSASFFHLSSGIIEQKRSGEQVKMMGYDLFSVYTVFRAIMETYATFNHLFVE